MHEALRRQYLALLGIEQWLPRGEPDPLAGAVAPAVPAAVSASAPGALATSEAGVSAAGASGPQATETLQNVSVAESSERVGCTLLPLADGLLLVAMLSTPDAPGLTGPEHEMLLRMAAALTPGRAPGAALEFHWPPRGARVPGLDRPGEAQKALAALLAERRRQGVRDVLLLGESLQAALAGACAQLDLRLVAAPSLAVMLVDPQAKRACWDVARPLVRPAP